MSDGTRNVSQNISQHIGQHIGRNIEQMNRTTETSDSNIDCHVLVLKGWPLIEVYSLANSDENYWHLVMDDLKQRFAQKTVILTTLHPFPAENDFEETDDYIKIRHAPTAVQVLRDFGPSIRKLKIEHVPKYKDAQSTRNVYELIHEQCYESLEQLQLRWLGQDFFLDTTRPFKRLTNLSLASDIMEINSGTENNFSDLFPVLRHLYLSYVEVRNTDILLVKYPQLEHLLVDVYVFDTPGYITEPEIIELIKKNTQLRSLIVKNVSPTLLKVIADHLKRLENLEIYRYDERKRDIYNFHFQNVKSFKIGNSFGQSMPAYITFGNNLKQFQVEAYPQDSKYISFVESNNSLKRFQMNGKFSLRDKDILRLATIKLNLTEMIINCEWGVNDENIIKLIENSDKLKRIQLKMHEKTVKAKLLATIWKLHKQFDQQWFISVIEYDILLERKSGRGGE